MGLNRLNCSPCMFYEWSGFWVIVLVDSLRFLVWIPRWQWASGLGVCGGCYRACSASFWVAVSGCVNRCCLPSHCFQFGFSALCLAGSLGVVSFTVRGVFSCFISSVVFLFLCPHVSSCDSAFVPNKFCYSKKKSYSLFFFFFFT